MDWKDLPLFAGNLGEPEKKEPQAKVRRQIVVGELPVSATPPTVTEVTVPVEAAKPAAVEAAKPKTMTVTELTVQIRGVLEPTFTQVWVQGEISNYRPAASGHAYFSLKDQGATISAAVFGWGSRKRSFELKDGLQVLCRGKVTVYPPRGSYQLTIEHIEPLGAGALQIAFEQLKAKLSAEGLFDQARKSASGLPQADRGGDLPLGSGYSGYA